MVKWKFEGLYKGVSAEKVDAELAEMGEGITPEMMVERAKDPSCELHKCFTWDDTEAAQKWRLHEARQIQCMLIRVEDTTKEEPRVIPLRVRYAPTDNDGYKTLMYIMERPDEKAALLERAKGELKAFRKKYAMLTELASVFEEIDKL